MTILALICREILGLFVEDHGLALTILFVLAIALLFAFVLLAEAAAGAALLLGCLGALAFSTLKARP
jgi:hypothetical protein